MNFNNIFDNINYVMVQQYKRQKIYDLYQADPIPMDICDSDDEEILDENDPLEPRRLFPEEEEQDEEVVLGLLRPPAPMLRSQYTSWIGEDGQIVYNSRYGNQYYDEDPIEDEEDDILVVDTQIIT